MQNIIEHLREVMVTDLFKMDTFNNSWEFWRDEIFSDIAEINALNIVDIGDRLKTIFTATNVGRTQSTVSGGGYSWEALVCWYLNLCLIGSRTVVIKQKKGLLPSPVSEALSVKYDSFVSNTESDLIAITFPNKTSYTCDKDDIYALNSSNQRIDNYHKGVFNYKKIIDYLIQTDFSKLQITVIQCKTNWNDNAQIPMMWDMLYSSDGFYRGNITVGSTLYKLRDIEFKYAFVTVPTGKSKYKVNSTSVQRVKNISGGNYWGKATESGVALSIKEMIGKNFIDGYDEDLGTVLNRNLEEIESRYNYFKIGG